MAKATISFDAESPAKHRVLDYLRPVFELDEDETAQKLSDAAFYAFRDAKLIRVRVEVETVE